MSRSLAGKHLLTVPCSYLLGLQGLNLARPENRLPFRFHKMSSEGNQSFSGGSNGYEKDLGMNRKRREGKGEGERQRQRHRVRERQRADLISQCVQ